MQLNPGHTIDRYEVERLLGAGGTAMVYLVRHSKLNTRHALKILSISSNSIRRRMLREGQVQASLKHLNVVTVTDVLDIDGSPGLLMEFIAGPSLETALRKYKLSMRDAETLFLGIVSGVRAAHKMGLVHRDLKPANVLLAKSRDGFIPKVTDFGLAKVLEEKGNTGTTRQGIAMGTPAYMAPEQIMDARSVDQRADVFSLGCILYELVTRHRTFPGDNTLKIYNAVTDGKFVPPRELVPDLPDRVENAILGALVVEREQRIPDCDTLLAVLRGERAWDILQEGTEEAPLHAPTTPSGPDLEVAERGPGGATPGPSPVREVAPPRFGVTQSLPSAPASDPIPPSDGTLTDHSLVDDESRTGMLALAALLTMMVAVLLIAVFVTGGVLYATSGPEQPEVPSLQIGLQPDELPAPPPEVPATADADEDEAPPTEVEPAPEAASAPATPTKAAPKPKPKPTPAPAPATAPTPQAPDLEEDGDAQAAAPAAAVTTKILSSPPTANLSINGKPRGKTPAKLTLPIGRHVVALQSGDQSTEFVIEVEAGGANKWCHAFTKDSTYHGNCPR